MVVDAAHFVGHHDINYLLSECAMRLDEDKNITDVWRSDMSNFVRDKRVLIATGILAAALIIIVINQLIGKAQPTYTYPEVYPEVLATNLEGKTVVVNSKGLEIEDQYLLIKLSDESCIYCRYTLEHMENYIEEYAVTGAILWKGNYSRNMELIKKHKTIHHHLIFDPAELPRVGLRYAGTPHYFLVDQHDNLLYSVVGYYPDRERQPIEDMLIEKVGKRIN